MFLSESDLNLFQYIKSLDLLSSIISLYFLLLVFEYFEHETLLTQNQMIGTILTTVAGIFILYATPQANWLIEEQMYFQSLDSSTTLFLNLFGGILGVLAISTLRRGLKDVWITQRGQLITMVVSVSIILFIPLILTIISFLFVDDPILITESLVRGMILLGYVVLTFSFGNTRHYSHYNRRKADKILVTNLNGIPLFHFDFKEDVHYINETLFSGAVVAITMLMSESIKSSSPIAEVLMKNKYRLMLETRASFIALILTPQANSYLRDSIERFSLAFDQKFTSIITSGEILDLNLFVKSGLGVLFENFGISTANVKEMIISLTMEETIT
jgi:membrane-associated HD superfamily phosphohydrolase